MAKFKISVDKEACIGCAACVSECSNFRMADTKAVPIKSVAGSIGCNEKAKEICPVEAIKIRKI